MMVFPVHTVTPVDYEPPGFRASAYDLGFLEEPTNIGVGEVSTVISHRFRLYLTCRMIIIIKHEYM